MKFRLKIYRTECGRFDWALFGAGLMVGAVYKGKDEYFVTAAGARREALRAARSLNIERGRIREDANVKEGKK